MSFRGMLHAIANGRRKRGQERQGWTPCGVPRRRQSHGRSDTPAVQAGNLELTGSRPRVNLAGQSSQVQPDAGRPTGCRVTCPNIIVCDMFSVVG